MYKSLIAVNCSYTAEKNKEEERGMSSAMCPSALLYTVQRFTVNIITLHTTGTHAGVTYSVHIVNVQVKTIGQFVLFLRLVIVESVMEGFAFFVFFIVN